MKKMAMFVEGRTDLEFDKKLICGIAHNKAITVESKSIRGGTKRPRSYDLLTTHHSAEPHTTTHFFLLYDCGSDNAVKDRMRYEYEHLARNGYTVIVCHRDVAPSIKHSEIAQLEAGLPKFVKTKPIVVTFVLSVMEIEAWFLAEYDHFTAIDPTITLDKIIANLGFDPSQDDLQLRKSPALDLEACYAIAGKSYDKLNTQPTIDALDLERIYVETQSRFPYLAKLCTTIEEFLDS